MPPYTSPTKRERSRRLFLRSSSSVKSELPGIDVRPKSTMIGDCKHEPEVVSPMATGNADGIALNIPGGSSELDQRRSRSDASPASQSDHDDGDLDLETQTPEPGPVPPEHDNMPPGPLPIPRQTSDSPAPHSDMDDALRELNPEQHDYELHPDSFEILSLASHAPSAPEIHIDAPRAPSGMPSVSYAHAVPGFANPQWIVPTRIWKQDGWTVMDFNEEAQSREEEDKTRLAIIFAKSTYVRIDIPCDANPHNCIELIKHDIAAQIQQIREHHCIGNILEFSIYPHTHYLDRNNRKAKSITISSTPSGLRLGYGGHAFMRRCRDIVSLMPHFPNVVANVLHNVISDELATRLITPALPGPEAFDRAHIDMATLHKPQPMIRLPTLATHTYDPLFVPNCCSAHQDDHERRRRDFHTASRCCERHSDIEAIPGQNPRRLDASAHMPPFRF